MDSRNHSQGTLGHYFSRRGFFKLAGWAGASVAVGDPFPITMATDQKPTGPDHGDVIPRGRAIVIGVEDYNPKYAKKLTGPVSDACRFVDWLLKKGHVQTSDVNLLCSPIPPNFPVPEIARRIKQATRDSILDTLKQLCPNRGDRLYFYFCGHGTEFSDTSLSGEDAIVPSDFKPGSQKPIPISYFRKFFDSSIFDEQFFFFDACRTVQAKNSVDGGDPPTARRPSDLPGHQFMAHSTKPGYPATGTGFFTEALLEALLRGSGSAKFFDPVQPKYLISWARMAGYIRDYFRDHPIQVDVNGHLVNQEPDIKESQVSDGLKPVLSEFTPAEIPDVTLTMRVDPPAALSSLHVDFHAAGIPPVPSIDKPTSALFSVKLRPQKYLVTVTTPGGGFYDPAYTREVELFTNRLIYVTLEPAVANSTLKIGQGSANVIIKAPDKNAVIALRASSPNYRHPHPFKFQPQFAKGALVAPALPPNTYVAMANLPSGRTVETHFRVDEPVVFHESGPKFYADLSKPQKIDFVMSQNIDFEPPQERVDSATCAESILKVLNPKLATRLVSVDASIDRAQTEELPYAPSILVQAARIMEREPQWGSELARIGLRPLATGSAGCRIMLAVDGKPGDVKQMLDAFDLRLGRLDQKEGKRVQFQPTAVPNLAIWLTDAEPGAYLLWYSKRAVAGGDNDRAQFAITLSNRHICELIFYQNSRGEIQFTQLQPALEPALSETPDEARTLNHVQRALQSEHPEAAQFLVDELTRPRLERPSHPKIKDPIGGAMALYLLSRQGKPLHLRVLANDVLNQYPMLPDAHVARAWSFESKVNPNPQEAVKEYRAALDNGIPILSRFLGLLSSAVDYYRIDHPRVPLLKRANRNVLPSLLWTAWRSTDDGSAR